MNKLYWLSVVLIAVIAAAFRFPCLNEKPMHADEAVLAAKLGDLLDSGLYTYDPADYHGPALLYGARLAARSTGHRSYPDLTETDLRVVPAAAGLLLALASLGLAAGLGRATASFASLLAAVSPALVYYSRYFIPEMLLVCFTFGAIVFGYRYACRPSLFRVLPVGICIGLAYATKETWVLALTAAGVALLLTIPPQEWRINPRHLIVGVAAAALIGGLLYTSFLAHPSGWKDSLAAYGTTYLDRVLHTERHAHPWGFYWQPLLFFRYAGGPIWSEAFVVVLAVIGFVSAFRLSDSRLPRFLACYTVLLAVAYTLIPYKTPWNFAGPILMISILAGSGAWSMLRTAAPGWPRSLIGLALAAALLYQAWQCWRTSFPYRADPRNPYVYAHTREDVLRLGTEIDDVAAVHPEGHSLAVEVISPANLWPLPWYLRRFPYVRWLRAVPVNEPPAPLILATPDIETALAERLYEAQPPGQGQLYVRLFDPPIQLRPQVEVHGYIVNTLWDRMRAR